jgi:hypothetical protein
MVDDRSRVHLVKERKTEKLNPKIKTYTIAGIPRYLHKKFGAVNTKIDNFRHHQICLLSVFSTISQILASTKAFI